MKKLLISFIMVVLFYPLVIGQTAQITGTVTSSEGGEGNFCVTGIKAFFEIVDILKCDQMPTEEQWSYFNNSPGYDKLVEYEFGDWYFRDLLTVIFKPSEKHRLSDVIEKYKRGGSYYQWALEPTINSLRDAENYRDEILSLAHYLSSKEALDEVEKYMSDYLPNRKIDQSFKINFIVFDDSRGYNTIIYGLTNSGIYSPREETCLKELGRGNYYPFILLLAHEAFHHYRNKMVSYIEPEGPERQIIWALNRIQNEGIADLINILPLYEEGGCFFNTKKSQDYIGEQNAQYAIIQSIDYLLKEISKKPELLPYLSGAVNNLTPRSGHPTGYFMAKTILNHFGNDYLRSIATNPFRFFLSYNDAAKQIENSPTFSEETIEYIMNLENLYYR
jgi:hypothetical protein